MVDDLEIRRHLYQTSILTLRHSGTLRSLSEAGRIIRIAQAITSLIHEHMNSTIEGFLAVRSIAMHTIGTTFHINRTRTIDNIDLKNIITVFTMISSDGTYRETIYGTDKGHWVEYYPFLVTVFQCFPLINVQVMLHLGNTSYFDTEPVYNLENAIRNTRTPIALEASPVLKKGMKIFSDSDLKTLQSKVPRGFTAFSDGKTIYIVAASIESIEIYFRYHLEGVKNG